MAGIEQLEIHSKSYIVRWVKVDDGYTVSWSVQPHKKSINFGIVKHPGTGGTNLTTTNHSEYTLAPEAAGSTDGANEGRGGIFARRDNSTAQEQLSKKGFIMVKWHGKCTADKVSTGTYDVKPGQGGMFGMVFDNTFSKQTSKNATFVVLTYPTGSAPQPGRNPPQSLLPGPPSANAANSSRTSLGRHGNSPQLGAAANESLDSLQSHVATGGGRLGTSVASQGAASSSSHYHTGLLLKRRRKRGQGYARRFFSLDFATCTLSYYHNRNTSALRGAIPLSLAAIAADERRREISIDSGAEIWHLKAPNTKEFGEWANALTRATRIARGSEQLSEPTGRDQASGPSLTTRAQAPNNQQEEDREWQQVEALVSRVVGTRDALRRLVKDMSAQNARPTPPSGGYLSPDTPTVSEERDGYFPQAPSESKRHFWKRKTSSAALSPAIQSSLNSQLAVPSPSSASTITPNGQNQQENRQPNQTSHSHDEVALHENCKALLGDLDSVVAEFSHLLGSSKRRRIPVPQSATSRHSIDSASTDEFFDAAEGEAADRSALLVIADNQSEDTPQSDPEEVEVHDDSSVSSVDGDEDEGTGADDSKLFPAKPKSLSPLPITTEISRRKTIPPPTMAPPSLIAAVRKNVGKDLSTITMPVSSNEPTSLLQRMAEQLEYAQLLDTAAKQKSARDRLLYVTAFAVSQYSGGRAKERSIRKPFNPLLGETYELLRAEPEVPGGVRLLVEKVSHRPVRLAMHADGAHWSFAQAPAPTQKFWGKSMELTTEGRVRVTLRLPQQQQQQQEADGASGSDTVEEHYSWAAANVFLRNVVMGEKYMEPAGTMSVFNDTTGAKAVVEFRHKGMFGGRSEDVQVETFGADGKHTGVSLSGTWTSGLRIVEAGKSAGAEVWRAAPLVEGPARNWGITAFAATLNEITDLEKGKLPRTDSRLRPDQRLAEEGNLDEAEEWKGKLEEAQRRRRREMEERGDEHRPRWFVKVADGGDGDEVWRLKGGKDGYWEERAKGAWTGVEEIFTE